MSERWTVLGGVYSNYLALEAVLDRSSESGSTFCLGDLGAFGPFPNRSIELLREAGIPVVQGNYDQSIGTDRDDCACGYTDPRDNHYARLSYAYTWRETSNDHKPWLAGLPRRIRRTAPSGERVLFCHGSPRRQSEFLWETISSDAFLARLMDAAECDVMVCTHTGLHWSRRLADGRLVVNCGAIGRPANDGRTEVWIAELDFSHTRAEVEFVPIAYDHERLASEIRAEELPEPFVETIETGWWTTCLEVLPEKERRRGRY